MGMPWGAGPAVVDLPAIAATMREALEKWMTARVQIFDPNRDAAPTTAYDPLADSGGFAAATMIYDSGVNGAIVQTIRSPTRIEAGIQPNAILGVRLQLKRTPLPTAPIRGGMLVKVVEAGEALGLTHLTFSVLEGLDSSITWDRIIDTAVLTGGQ